MNSVRKMVSVLAIAISLLLCGIAPTQDALAETTIETITLSTVGFSVPDAGIYDAGTKTGVLSRDVNGTIRITADGITLDGAGYTIRGNGQNNGVYAQSVHFITIRNVTISGCNNGIMLSWSNNNTIQNNTLTQNTNANLYFSRSEYNYVSGNQITSSTHNGLLMREFADNSVLENNTFSGNAIGINLQGAQRNMIFHNTIENNRTGVFINDSPTNQYNIPSSQNQIYQNNFLGNATHANNYNNAINMDNRFFRNIPDGGNYWSGNTGADANADGIADTPYLYTGGQDNLPWTSPSGWEGWNGNPDAIPYLYVYLEDDGWSEAVGTWDPATRTAVLTRDVTGSISIVANNVTLDGNGHRVTGDGNGIGVQIASQGYITVKNISLSNHLFGFSLTNAYDSEISHCTVSNSTYGFYLFESRRNRLINNESQSNTAGVTLSTLSDENTLQGNLINDCTNGLDLPGSFDNVITENTICNNTNVGIQIRLQQYTGTSVLRSNRNQVYRNNFIKNTTQAQIYAEGTENRFNLDTPTGGNYWDNFTAADTNKDGFADAAYMFNGGQDKLPLINQFGWHDKEASDDKGLIEQINDILIFYDEAVSADRLKGIDSRKKTGELRKMFSSVVDEIEKSQLKEAYQQISTILPLIDGEKTPKDMVTGPDRAVLEEMVSGLLTELKKQIG